ncbi:hypothetical protein [Halorientalis halophila]
MTRRYTDAENTGAPVVPLVAERPETGSRTDHDEQVLSHRTPRA